MDQLISSAPRRRLYTMLGLLFAAFAAPAAETEHREHGAHEHGHGTLNVAIEGTDVIIELRVPGVNVVGFEHEPETDDDRRAVDRALADFRQAAKLFEPSMSAKCEMESVEVSFAGEMHHEGEAHDKHSEHGEKHAEHGEGGREQEEHAELHGEYHFHCAAPENLELIEVKLFDYLKDTEELEAQLVTPDLQSATTLRPGGATSLKLRR